MSNLSIIYTHRCKSFSEFEATGSNGQIYHLHLENNIWNCTCQGYTFRGRCKHQKQAEENSTCGWFQPFDGGKPIEENGEKKCPECSSPVEVIQYGI